MKVKTKDLIDQALDWAVEVAKGSSVYMRHDFMSQRHSYLQSSTDLFWHLANQDNDPIIGDVLTGETRFLPKNSTDWSQGGPIIERENITLIRANDTYGVDSNGYCNGVRIPQWFAECSQWIGHSITNSCAGENMEPTFMIDEDGQYGPTPLIAAMRCYVMSKLGDEVEIPDELVNL